MESFVVVIQNAGDNFGAYSPDVWGCIATGATVEETTAEMKLALEFHLEGLAMDGDELPTGKGLAYYLSRAEPIAETGDYILLLSVALPQLQPV